MSKQHKCQLCLQNTVGAVYFKFLYHVGTLSYQVVHWSVVPVGTSEDTVLIWKSIYETANKPRKLAGRDGNKPTKARIDITYVNFCHMV